MIETIPDSERPRERCLESGPATLSLRECLAQILGSGPPKIGCLGLATQILQRPGCGLDATEEERAFFTAMEVGGSSYLRTFHGLGPAGQARILAAFELGRRYSIFRGRSNSNAPRTHGQSLSKLASQVLRKISSKQRMEPQEWLGFVPVHRSGVLGEFCVVERGVRTHVNFEPAELFARILALRPSGYFLVHNHPSGVATPSPKDLDLTARLNEISQTLGIRLLGHWIITPQGEHLIPLE